MSQTVFLISALLIRHALRTITDDRCRPLKHILWARIVLCRTAAFPCWRLPSRPVSADRRYGVGSNASWRKAWTACCTTRPDRPGRLPSRKRGAGRCGETPTGEPPDTVAQWTGRTMAAACGLSLTTVQRIWRFHRLKPHRVRTFKRSTDPQLATQARRHRGALYVAPASCGGAVRRREEPKPSPRPHAIGPAAQARQVRLHPKRKSGCETLRLDCNRTSVLAKLKLSHPCWLSATGKLIHAH